MEMSESSQTLWGWRGSEVLQPSASRDGLCSKHKGLMAHALKLPFIQKLSI